MTNNKVKNKLNKAGSKMKQMIELEQKCYYTGIPYAQEAREENIRKFIASIKRTKSDF